MSRLNARNVLFTSMFAVLGYSAASYARPPLEPIVCHPSEEVCEDLADAVYDACIEGGGTASQCNNAWGNAYRECRDQVIPCWTP